MRREELWDLRVGEKGEAGSDDPWVGLEKQKEKCRRASFFQ